MPRYVGTRVRRQEDPALLRGQARYIGDRKVPGLLTVAFLRSPHPHARLLLRELRVPTLVIVGEEDTPALDASRFLAKTIQDATLGSCPEPGTL